MHTPHNSSDITESWIEFIITQYECKKIKNTTVTIKSFYYNRATKPGESFNAELVKLEIDAILNGGERPPGGEEKQYSLIVKFLSRDPYSREMIRKLEYHAREFLMYSEVIPELNKFQASQTDNAFPIQAPEYIYGKCTGKDYVLVIENMKILGYETNPKEKGLELNQAMMAVEHLARLHGVSYAFDQKHNFLSKYPIYTFSSRISALFKPVVYISLDNAIKFLHTKDDCKEIVKKLESGKRCLPNKFEAMWDDVSRHKMMCLTHGDFWNSNLLFLYSNGEMEGEKELNNLCLIDWQISQWNNPVMDLHYLLNTSTTAQLRKSHLSDLLHHYHKILTEVTVGLGNPIPEWTYDEFRVEYDRKSLVGLLMGMCLIQGTLSKAGEKINLQEQNEKCGCGISFCVYCLKASTAKIVVPFAFHKYGKSIIKISLKKLLNPIKGELLSGENQVMNTRLVELVMEADDKGLLDVLNM